MVCRVPGETHPERPKTSNGVPLMADFGLPFFFYFGILTAFSAFVQGFTGLGFGIIIMAGLSFLPVDLERMSVAVNLLLVLLNTTIIYAGRKDFRIDWRLVWLILFGELLGVPFGYWFILVFGDRPVFRLALGIALFLMAVHQLVRPKVRRELGSAFGVLAGAVGGFLAGAFTAAGPPIAYFVYSRHRDPARCKGTLQVVFMSATLLRLVNIIFIGRGVTLPMMKIAAFGLPFVIVLTTVGHLVTRRISPDTFMKVVFAVIAVAGLVNIYRVLA